MSLPTVSVLMAVYNRERYLAKAIESILQQTLPAFELIVIDDGSTDRSLAILQAYAEQDSRIRFTSWENRGIPGTRNELIQQASADLLAIMDSDDIALPDRLALQVAFMQQHPEVVCLGGAFQLIDAKDRLIKTLAVPLTNPEIQRLILAGHPGVPQPCAMLRRQTVLQVGGYNETMTQAEDLDLWLRLGEVGELANLPNPLVQYRLHSDSVSEQDNPLQRQKAREACEQAWQRRGISGQFEANIPWRPGADRQSRHQFMLQYGWWAFSSSQRQTALIYAIKALWLRPQAATGWKLLVCALIKPLPTTEANL